MLPTFALLLLAVATADDPPTARPKEPSPEYSRALRSTREHQARQRASAARRRAAARGSMAGGQAVGGEPDSAPPPAASRSMVSDANHDGHLHTLAHLPYIPGLGLAGVGLTAPGLG